ncbi:MAG: glucose-6-phosphate isomerase [Solobacterium sp.]|nr:glucose-6-phosphate isomerase [Solobacterium sp.]MBQ1446496.1 glucose-6-phosphate isomerase [Solobacterium sp.]MBR2726349.1 glucose-6-phosphate isomerase [Solobacterium sp.]
MITLNDRFAGSFDVAPYQEIVTKIHRMIHDKTGAGNDFLGWVDWALNYDEEEFARMIDAAERLKDRTDVVVVCGIGGSYLGARAAIEMIKGLYPSTGPEIIFAGNTFSGTYMKQVMDYIKDKRTVVNVISKSGTTTETALAFRILRAHMEEKYGKEGARERILCTTDKARGVLKELADREGYETFVIPDDIGGRYSGLTAVGLLPMALAGINIREVMKGFLKANHDLNTDDLKVNDAYRYAVERRILQARGYDVEMYVSYEMQMRSYMEWLKQLFGESEGKEGKGILPDSVIFSTDLHSLGQFIQEGKKVLFETVIEVKDPGCAMVVPEDAENSDGMNYLSGKKLDWVNAQAMEGTLKAHYETGSVPNLIITIPDMKAETFGYMCYWFFVACAMTCYMLDINPFNQPGVEVYKKNMFKLLGKPGA